MAATLLFSIGSASAEPKTDCGPTLSQRCETWTATYDGPARGQDAATAMAVSPSGGSLFVAGRSIDSNDDLTVVSYNVAGLERWVKRYNGPGNGTDAAVAIATDGFQVYVVGTSDGSGTSSDLVTIAYDANSGEEVWTKRFDGAGAEDVAKGIALSPNGSNVYVTGYTAAGTTPSGVANYDAVTIAYDILSGDELWATTFEGDAAFWDLPSGVAAVADLDGERVAITMRSNVASTANTATDYVTIGYDGWTGEQLWRRDYDNGGREYPYAITASDDDTQFFVTGESSGTSTGLDYATVAYDSLTGAQDWAARHAATGSDDRALDVKSGGDGVFVTGFIPGDAGNVDRRTETVAYDRTTGALRWSSRHATEGGEAGSELVISPDGQHVYVGALTIGQAVVVNGPTVTASGFEAMSLKASSGALEWIGHLEAAGVTAGIGLSPNGGELYIAGGEADIVTAAYETGFALPPPPAPASISVAPSVINNANKTSVTITGTARPNDWMIIALADNGKAEGCGKAAGPDGSFSCTVNATTLSDGSLEARARVVDNATNQYSSFTKVSVLKDTVAPAAPAITLPARIGTPTKAAVPLSGTGEAGATVSVALTDGVATAAASGIVGSNGRWSATADVSTFVDGVVQASATQSDVAGNPGPAATTSSLKDTVAPDAPVIASPAAGSSNPASVSFSGTAEPGSVVTVSEGTLAKASTTATAGGTWSVSTPFASGTRTASVRARDAAGNVSAAATVVFDVTAPPSPVITAPAPDASVPSSVTIRGTAQNGLRVRVLDGTKTLGTVNVSNGEWSLTAPLSDGAHTLSAVGIDSQGSSSAPSNAVPVSVDAKIPTVAITTPDRNLHAYQLFLTGTATDNRGVKRVEIRVVDQLGTVVAKTDAACEACSAPSVEWMAEIRVQPGVYTVQAVSYDAVGNPSPPKKITAIKA